MNNEKKRHSIKERQDHDKDAVLAELKRMPILKIACERAGIGHTTYYRWRDDDKEFRRLADEALKEGEALITDMSESQLISLIKDKHFPSIALWLRQHHPRYADRLEVRAKISSEDEELTPKQKKIVEEALRLSLPDRGQEKNHG